MSIVSEWETAGAGFLFGDDGRLKSEVIPIDNRIPCRSPVSWVGNKSPILGIILSLLPVSCPRFVDVFGGSGSVLLGKPPDPFEVYNDFDGDLVNLFRVMKDRPLAFIRELGFLTLNSRDDFRVLKKFLNQEEFADAFLSEEMQLTRTLLAEPEADEIAKMMLTKAKDHDVRRAAAYLKLLRYSYASGKKSFASQPFDIRRLFALVFDAHARLASVVIENKDFEALIRHYDREDTVFYCDPPYYTTEGMYTTVFTQEDHHRLFQTLAGAKGEWLLSYNDCAFIRELYQDYSLFSFERIHTMAQRYSAGSMFSELLIGNYDLFERERTQPCQLTLFGEDEPDGEKVWKERI